MACKRCGTCCVLKPCRFSNAVEGEICSHLTINDDLTTTCERREEYTEYYIGFSQTCDFQWVPPLVRKVEEVRELLASKG